jgi:type II secretion system protein J
MILNRGQQSGFTLLEIIIALAILALVFSSLYGAYSGTVETNYQVDSSRDVEQAVRLALMQMADDLKSLYHQPRAGNPQASPYRFVSSGVASESDDGAVIEFATTAHLGFDAVFPSLRVNRVGYSLKGAVEGEGYRRLVRRETPFADLGGEWGETAVELIDGVEELTFAFLDSDGQELHEWDSTAPQTTNRLPRLVHIRLRIAAGEAGGSRLFTTAVALPPQEETPGP